MRASYFFLALGLSLGVFLGISWAPAVGLWLLLLQGAHSPSEALFLSARLFGLAFTDKPAWSTFYDLFVSLLIGANASLLAFLWRQGGMRGAKAGGISGIAGIAAAVFGFGCAACGGLFLTLLLTSLGAGAISALPIFENGFLQAIGIILLIVSTCLLYGRAREPAVCLPK